MQSNQITETGFSNPDAAKAYNEGWPNDSVCKLQHENGLQCGSCAFFAPFNSDWGLCCNPKSSHKFETVFEHFTCIEIVNEGWGPHSFTCDESFHCRCNGASVYEILQTVIAFLAREDLSEDLRKHLDKLEGDLREKPGQRTDS